jgi:hypothetical protein
MPDKDDKNSGHTSLPDQYERSKTEVEDIEDGHKPSLKSANDREANAPRNHDQKTKEEQDAAHVPSSKQV